MRYFSSVIDGIDRTQCCASKGMSDQCLGACSGNIANIPINIIDCQKHIYSFASCYDIMLPTPGEHVCNKFYHMPLKGHLKTHLFKLSLPTDWHSTPILMYLVDYIDLQFYFTGQSVGCHKFTAKWKSAFLVIFYYSTDCNIQIFYLLWK